MLFGLLTRLKSKLLSRRSKVTSYKVLISPVALYACETWATIKRDENELGVFIRKIHRKIIGSQKNEEGWFEVWTKYEELRRLLRNYGNQ